MRAADAIAFAGHEVHVCRYREAHTLLRWLGEDLRGLTVLDVAGGDGYWAAQARKRGAYAVALDLDGAKLSRGGQLTKAPALIRGDALSLPFPDASFDRLISICAIEHFDDGGRALDEMARVLKPGGELVMSADALTERDRWPHLFEAHCRRYHVQRTYTLAELTGLLHDRGLDVLDSTYQFRSPWAQRFYLTLSAHGGRVGFNAAAPALPIIAAADRRAAAADRRAAAASRRPPAASRRPPAAAAETGAIQNANGYEQEGKEGGAIVLVHARRAHAPARLPVVKCSSALARKA